MAIKNVRDRGAGTNPEADTGIINTVIQEAVAEGGGTGVLSSRRLSHQK